MRKTAILLALVFCVFAAVSFAAAKNGSSANNTEIFISGSFKILNDTDAEVQIYTGSGFIELNKGASTSVTCEAGREIRKATKGKKGDVIFTVDDSMCGKTVKLSKYL